MNTLFESNKLDLYFHDLVEDKETRRRFNNVIENPTQDQINGFSGAIANLTEPFNTHSLLVTSTMYTNA